MDRLVNFILPLLSQLDPECNISLDPSDNINIKLFGENHIIEKKIGQILDDIGVATFNDKLSLINKMPKDAILDKIAKDEDEEWRKFGGYSEEDWENLANEAKEQVANIPKLYSARRTPELDWDRQPIFDFIPKPDITAYEMANIFANCILKPIIQDTYEQLSDNSKRHLTFIGYAK